MTSSAPTALHRVILGIGLFGVGLSLLAFDALRTQLAGHSRLEFQWLAKDRVGAVQRGLDEAIHLVDIIGDLVAIHAPSKSEFTQLARRYLSKIHGIRELVWIPRDDNQAAVPLRACRTHSFFPKDHDFLSDTVLTPLLNLAERQGRSVVSTLHHPVLPSQHGLSEEFVVLVPLRETAGADARTQGFLLAVFDLEELIQQAIRLLEPRGVQILILEKDPRNQERLINAYQSRLEPSSADPLDTLNWRVWLGRQRTVIRETVPVADQQWEIIAVPSKNLLSGEEFPHTPWLILAGGIFITGLLVLFLIHVEQSILEKNRIHAELKQSELKLRILFNQYPDTIMTVDRQGSVLLTNRPEVRTLEEMFGEHQTELRDWHIQALRKVYATGEMDHFQFPFSDTQWCEVRFVPIRAEGSIAEVMILSTDITEKHTQQEQALRHARLASLGILAAGMAHEINNPNNTIQFNIVALSRSWPDMAAVLKKYQEEHGDFILGGVPVERALEMLPGLMESILNNSRRITGIVNNLKHMARPDPGGCLYRIELHKVIRNVISIMQHPIKRHTDHFVASLPESLPELRGNALQLEQIFLNLLLNALESLKNRKARVTLDANLSEDGEWVIVRVTDEGVGMSEQQMANMFTPFFTTKGDQGGIGMGLSIVWDIVQRHGGIIKTESQPEVGTSIAVFLPVHHPSQEAS
ncbi:MAG: PAS domain-containing protein [Magnetococcales bacterium]|nr:PAS domain-containing protein [Magnetococcales bacterium]